MSELDLDNLEEINFNEDNFDFNEDSKNQNLDNNKNQDLTNIKVTVIKKGHDTDSIHLKILILKNF